MSQTVIGSRRPAVHVHRGPRYDARSRHHGSPSPQRPALPPPHPASTLSSVTHPFRCSSLVFLSVFGLVPGRTFSAHVGRLKKITKTF